MEKTAKGEEVLSWNSLLPIQQRFKSIPGGSLLFVPDNTSYTLRYFAEQMIQRSDNTATDHLPTPNDFSASIS
jgi:beta-lactamase class A